MEKITVIIPVYKVEKYLDKCIESVVNQTYRNLEIILVDDGSPDNCPEICDAWARKDDRIIVIHKGNGGLSDARNAGLDIATGDYIAFIDSDDYVSKDYIEKLLRALTTNGADIAAISFEKVDENGCKYPQVGTGCFAKNIYSGREILYDAYNYKGEQTAFVVVWGKLYRKYLFASYRFATGRLNEDEFSFYPIYLSADKVACLSDMGYYYLQRSDSIMGKGISLKRIEDNYACWIERLAMSGNDDILNKKTAVGLCSWIFLTALPNVEKSSKMGTELTKHYKEGVRKYIFCKDINLPLYHKIIYAMATINPWQFSHIKARMKKLVSGD